MTTQIKQVDLSPGLSHLTHYAKYRVQQRMKNSQQQMLIFSIQKAYLFLTSLFLDEKILIFCREHSREFSFHNKASLKIS